MITTGILNDITVCSFDQSNKLNALISEEVKREVGKNFDKPDTKLILDLKNIGFADSSGFGALLSIMRSAKNNSGIFRICNIAPDVMKVFRLLQLHKVFEIYDNLEDCLESFS